MTRAQAVGLGAAGQQDNFRRVTQTGRQSYPSTRVEGPCSRVCLHWGNPDLGGVTRHERCRSVDMITQAEDRMVQGGQGDPRKVRIEVIAVAGMLEEARRAEHDMCEHEQHSWATRASHLIIATASSWKARLCTGTVPRCEHGFDVNRAVHHHREGFLKQGLAWHRTQGQHGLCGKTCVHTLFDGVCHTEVNTIR